MTTTPPLLIPETAKEKRLQRRRRRDFHRAHAFWVVKVGSLKAAVCLSLSLSFERSSSRRSEKAYTVGVKSFLFSDEFPQKKTFFLMTTSSSSSDSDDDEFENEKNDHDVTETTKEGGNKNDVDFLVREAMREEKLKLKSKLKEKKRTTVLPNGEDDDDDKGALNGANAKETEEEAMIETIKSKETIEDATRARKRARTLLGKADDFNEEEEEEKEENSREEDEEEEEEEEAKMDRFDMSKEEQEGYFDQETGNYVEYKKEKKLAEDSWIDETTKEEYEKFKTVKPSSQRLMEAEKAAEEDEEMKYDQTEEGVAKLKRQLAELLEGSTETALRAIKRVGGGSGGPGNTNSKNKYVSKQKSMKNGKTKQQEKERGKSVKLEGENKKIFDEITAIASRLVAAGEYGAYTIEKQMLEKSANLVLKLEAKTTYEDAEDDMFADSDDDDDDDEGVRKSAKKGSAETESAAVAASVVDPKTFSIKELKRCLESHGRSIGAGGGERIDIEKMCLEALKSTIAPDGFAYDKSTGLYYGEASKMHWHCKANVYKTEDGNWWKYNGQMFEAASEP